MAESMTETLEATWESMAKLAEHPECPPSMLSSLTEFIHNVTCEAEDFDAGAVQAAKLRHVVPVAARILEHHDRTTFKRRRAA